MAVNQVISRLQNHIRNVNLTQAMRDAAVAARIANRRDNTLIQARKAATGRINVPVDFRPFSPAPVVAPIVEP